MSRAIEAQDNQTREDITLMMAQEALGEDIIALINTAQKGLTYDLIGMKSCEEGMAILKERIIRLLTADARIKAIHNVKIACENIEQEIAFTVESICGTFGVQCVLAAY